MKKRGFFAAAAAALLLITAGCGEGSQYEKLLDPSEPVTITVWHYYNGAQQAAFDSLVETFNETEGRKRGIIVEEYGQGSVTELEVKVRASLHKEVGSSQMPDIFSAYSDTAYSFMKEGALADLGVYITEEEQETYVGSFLEEGRIGENGALIIFPIAKSTEILMLNKTDWNLFAEATGAQYGDLKTMEKVADTAQKYYEWTDAQTPDIKGDGRAFYGRDAMANLFYITARQLGTELVEVQPGKAPVLHADRKILKKIWDTWYVPTVKGYFGAYGRFRSDDVKTGEIIAYTGSTASAPYFPDHAEPEGRPSYPVEYVVLPAPVAEDGEPYAIQQGAGMVVSKSSALREYASVVFLEWFAREENNMKFCVNSGYLPVKRGACTEESLNRLRQENEDIPAKTCDAMLVAFESVKNDRMYANKVYENVDEVRRTLETGLSQKAASAAAAVSAAVEDGAGLEEAAAPYVSEEAFDNWYREFRRAIQPAGPDGKGEDRSILD